MCGGNTECKDTNFLPRRLTAVVAVAVPVPVPALLLPTLVAAGLGGEGIPGGSVVFFRMEGGGDLLRSLALLLLASSEPYCPKRSILLSLGFLSQQRRTTQVWILARCYVMKDLPLFVASCSSQ